MAIRQRYGSPAELARVFGIELEQYCADNVGAAIRKGVPPFARIVKAYGVEAVSVLLQAHIVDCLIAMGETRDIEPGDARRMAAAICGNATVRVLNFATVIGFFYRLKTGFYKIYGAVTPRKIAEAFNDYAAQMQAAEQRIYIELEAEAKAEAAAEAERVGMSWDEYRQRHGIPDATPAKYAARQAAINRSIATIAELLRQVIEISAKAKQPDLSHSETPNEEKQRNPHSAH